MDSLRLDFGLKKLTFLKIDFAKFFTRIKSSPINNFETKIPFKSRISEDNLIASANLEKNKINLEGVISYNLKTEMPFKDINYNLIGITKESEFSKDFILVDNPMHYLRSRSLFSYVLLILSKSFIA